MAILNFLTSNTRTIGGIEIDATIQEDHDHSVELTKNPIEFGADVNDHRIIQPIVLNIEGAVTDDPLGLEGFTSFFSGSSSRSKGAWRDLIDLQETAEPFDVQTGLQLYTSMVITNLKATTNKDNPRMLRFTATLTELRVVFTELTRFPSSSLSGNNIISQATSAASKGQIQSLPVPSNSSFLNNALSSLGF